MFCLVCTGVTLRHFYEGRFMKDVVWLHIILSELTSRKLFKGTREEFNRILEMEDKAKQETLNMSNIYRLSLEEFKEAETPVNSRKYFVDLQAKALQIHNKKLKAKATKKKRVYDKHVKRLKTTKGEEWDMMLPIPRKKKNKVIPNLIKSQGSFCLKDRSEEEEGCQNFMKLLDEMIAQRPGKHVLTTKKANWD
ncbi:hypothetical protein Tco_1134800 [Tanacetum coccineum]